MTIGVKTKTDCLAISHCFNSGLHQQTCVKTPIGRLKDRKKYVKNILYSHLCITQRNDLNY